jgi:hypothetical protein
MAKAMKVMKSTSMKVKTKSFMPLKKRSKRRIQRESTRVRNLEESRRARKAYQAKRKRLEKTGILYTPPSQVVPKVRRGRLSLKSMTGFRDLLRMSEQSAYRKQVSLGYLPNPKNAKCPGCKKKLGKVFFRQGKHPSQRCQRTSCGGDRWVTCTKGTWADHKVPLSKLGAVAWLQSGQLTKRPGSGDTALLTGVSNAVCQKVSNDVLGITIRKSKKEQMMTKLSGQREGDATTLRVIRLKNGRLLHIRAFALWKRGDHTKGVIYMLPEYTSPPGGKTRPESIEETDPIIKKHQANQRTIWHTDGARCYRHLKTNTRVKHSKRIYAAVRKLKLQDGEVLVCYGGTQLQDGLWKHLGDSVPQTMNTRSDAMKAKLEQWMHYWAWRFRRASCKDMFVELGATIKDVKGY